MSAPHPPAPDRQMVSLKILETGETLSPPLQPEILLGRAEGGYAQPPDVDLSPYQAYKEGVSRHHACLRITREQVEVLDLGSANGTRVNGETILPHLPIPLAHGDILTLGRLKLQILIVTGDIKKPF